MDVQRRRGAAAVRGCGSVLSAGAAWNSAVDTMHFDFLDGYDKIVGSAGKDKKFGTKESSRFINGVLDRIHKELRPTS